MREILKMLKNRTEELRLLKKDSALKKSQGMTSQAKNEIKKMFFDDSIKTDLGEEDKQKREDSNHLDST